MPVSTLICDVPLHAGLFVFAHDYSLDTSVFLDKVALQWNAFRCCLLI